jgi:hypothetical protein
MNERGTHEDNYHKLSVETAAVREECNRAYAIWQDAGARLARLERLTNAAWREVSGLRALNESRADGEEQKR